MNSKVIAIIVGAVFVIILIVFLPSQDTFIHAQSEQFAKEWIEEKLEIYVENGSNLQLTENEALGLVNCHLCYAFTYTFDTNDTEEPTTHTVSILMEEGRITKKTLNGSSLIE